jgi:hypothetical protein
MHQLTYQLIKKYSPAALDDRAWELNLINKTVELNKSVLAHFNQTPSRTFEHEVKKVSSELDLEAYARGHQHIKWKLDAYRENLSAKECVESKLNFSAEVNAFLEIRLKNSIIKAELSTREGMEALGFEKACKDLVSPVNDAFVSLRNKIDLNFHYNEYVIEKLADFFVDMSLQDISTFMSALKANELQMLHYVEPLLINHIGSLSYSLIAISIFKTGNFASLMDKASYLAKKRKLPFYSLFSNEKRSVIANYAFMGIGPFSMGFLSAYFLIRPASIVQKTPYLSNPIYQSFFRKGIMECSSKVIGIVFQSANLISEITSAAILGFLKGKVDMVSVGKDLIKEAGK